MRLPDLTGYNKFPTPIAISVNDGEWISPSVLAEDSCFWVGYALTNAGAGIVENVDVEISVDGNIIHDNTLASVGNGYYWYRYGIYTLESGKHEITFTIDPDNKIKESNEGNNTYTCSFVVEGPADWLIPFSWDQGGELFNTDVTINAYAPIDPDTGKRSITGCTNTAVTQVISYFVTQGHDLSLTLNNSDSYTEGGISIDGTLANARRNGNLSFDQINALLADFDVKSAEDVAALCYASGVVAKANYGSDATCTAYSTELFTRAGFKSVSTGNYEFWNGNKLSDKAWETVKRNISEERPVCVSLNKPNHAVIIDGYDSASDRVHINFGWGLTNGKKLDSRYDMILGSGWYTRAECDEMQVDYIMYDIVPNSPGDLRVDNIASLVAADKVKLDFKVANNGFNDIEASKAYIYDGTKKIATVSVDALKAKTSQVYTYYIAAGGLTAGTHKFKVVADGADMVKESFEDNNSRIKSVSITRDLQVSALTYARNTSADTVKLNFTVKNNGNVASGTHRAYVYDGTKKLATFSLSSIAGGVSKNYSYTLNAGNLAIGTHNFKVIADGAKTIKETNESNNALTRSVSITRDLQVSALTYARSSSANTVKLNFTVKSNGNTASGAYKAYLYDGTKKLATFSLSSIAGGVSKNYSYTLNAGNLAIGTHNFKVIADGAKLIRESNENNNSLTKSVSITRDLQVSALTYARNSSANTVKLNFTVKNNGNSRIGATKAYIYDGTKKLGTLSLAAFTAGASKTYSYTLNAGNLAIGTHNFKVIADGAKLIRESNENNNSLTKSVSITRDLQVSALTYARNTSANTVKLNFTVKNNGNSRIGATKAYIYDGTKKLGTLSLAAFTAGASKTYSYTLNAGNLAIGTHKFKVIADGAGAVKESKENNNSLTKSISVTRDLQVSALTYARNTSANTVKLNFTVKNNGNSRVGASKAYLYDGSKKLATLSLAAFTANSSRSFSYTLNAANLANGTHKFKIVADGANSYRENNEKNNSLTNSVSVTRNLQVSSLSAEPGTENVKLTFTIKNTGNTRIGASKAYIYDGTKKLVTLSLASFNGNSGRSFSYTFAAGKLSAGTHNLKVVTTHSSSTLAVKVAPAVNKTIGGIANDVWDYMYEDLPKEAQYGNVTGSMFNDTLTFSANRSRRIGNISLASGNDKIIALNSAIYCEESEIVAGNIDMGSGNDTIAIGSNNDFEVKFIDMGSGNDTITVSGWDAELEVLDVLKCGSGNDTITVSSQAFVEFNSFDMGDGADRFTVSGGSHLYYSKDYNFGSGDDRFIVAAGGHLDFSEYYGEPGSGSGLDFGSGYDTLQLDGVLRLSSAEKCVSNLEKITGSGDIALDLTGSPDIDWIDKLLEGSDVEVINDLGLSFFNGRAAEANDNVISGSSVQSLTSQSNPHGVDFWLCGNAKAEAVDHGFADTTDFVKYTKSSGDNRLEISTWWGYGDLSDVLEVDVFNANGQQLTDDQYSFMVSDYLEADISQWQDGTYYLKLKVADTSAVSGMIRISD
ncbi:MAG: hypothetical protein E7050_08230 [Lentisphaerae bacterium]|nr:hypothetical protein [Lentisphaerota bacterium]